MGLGLWLGHLSEQRGACDLVLGARRAERWYAVLGHLVRVRVRVRVRAMVRVGVRARVRVKVKE